MKKVEIKVGGTYLAKVSGAVVPVRIQSEHPRSGWVGVNTVTHREVRIKTAARLRREAKPHQPNEAKE